MTPRNSDGGIQEKEINIRDITDENIKNLKEFINLQNKKIHNNERYHRGEH